MGMAPLQAGGFATVDVPPAADTARAAQDGRKVPILNARSAANPVNVESVDLDVSTLANWVGTCAAMLMPIRDAIEEHVHWAERLHVDHTTPKEKLPLRGRNASWEVERVPQRTPGRPSA